jgi:hypothetical protein
VASLAAAALSAALRIAVTEGGMDFIHVLYSAASCAMETAASAAPPAIRIKALRMAGIYHIHILDGGSGMTGQE